MIRELRRELPNGGMAGPRTAASTPANGGIAEPRTAARSPANRGMESRERRRKLPEPRMESRERRHKLRERGHQGSRRADSLAARDKTREQNNTLEKTNKTKRGEGTTLTVLVWSSVRVHTAGREEEHADEEILQNNSL